MKLTIKEIKEKCETDDPVKFKATIDKVWEFKEKKSKYYIGYQNIIVKDDTDKIKVIFSKIKKQEDIYKDDIEGKEVEVSGTVSLYTNPNSGEKEINIFGVITFEKEELKAQGGAVATSIGELRVAKQPGLTMPEIRLKCLFIAKEILKLDNATAKNIIHEARFLEAYVCKGTVAGKKEQEKPEEYPGEHDEEEREDPKPKLSPEKVKQINMLIALAENRGKEGKEYLNDLIVIKGYKTIKEFENKDIEEATKKLENMGSGEIPF